jgi:nucleoside-diphosphate-sugar epimerase
MAIRLPAEKLNVLRPFYSGREVCVTGGAGFIGGHLVDALFWLGASVRVIDDLSNSTLEHLSELIETDSDRVRFVHGSILDDEAVSDAIDGCKTVFHLAALGSVPRSVEQPQRYWSVNTTGTLRVLEAARAAGVERVVFASSSSVYGDQAELPKVESQTVKPMSPYAATKVSGEHLMSVWAQCYGISTVGLRYFNVFGPRQSADSGYAAVVPAFAKAMLSGERPTINGDGTQTRDFTYVGNAVYATLLGGSATTELKGQGLNVGTARRISILDLATAIGKLCGLTSVQPNFKPTRAGDVMHSAADITRAKALLGYEPITKLEDGLSETVAAYREAYSGSRGDENPHGNASGSR